MKTKWFWLGALLVSVAVAVFGFVLPCLFSAANTELVLLGWVVLVVFIGILVAIVGRLYKKLTQNEEIRNENS